MNFLRLKFFHFSLFSIASVLEKSSNYIVMMILTFFLSSSEVGAISLYQTTLYLIIPALSLGLWSYLDIQYIQKGEQFFSNYFIVVYRIIIILLLILTITFILLSNNLSNYYNIDYTYILFIPLIAFFNTNFMLLQSFLAISIKPGLYLFNSAIKVITLFLTAITFVIFLDGGINGRLKSIITTEIITFIIAIYYFFKFNFFIHIDNTYESKDVLKFGIATMPHLVAQVLIGFSDRLFISYYQSNSQVGVYDIAYRISMIVIIGAQIFLTVWRPYLYKNLRSIKKPQSQKILVVGTYCFILVLIGISLLIITASPLLYANFIGKDFIVGIDYIPLLTLGNFFYGIYLTILGFLFYRKEINKILMISSIGVLVNLLLNYFFVPVLGTIGAVYSTIISNLLLLIFVIIGFKSVIKTKLPWFDFKNLLLISK